MRKRETLARQLRVVHQHWTIMKRSTNSIKREEKGMGSHSSVASLECIQLRLSGREGISRDDGL